MHELVNVLRIVELQPEESVERELALITVAAPPDKRAELIALGEVFGARVADIGTDSLTFELVGRPEELDAFEELVRPHGVRELARTGRIGLRRSRPASSAVARAAGRLDSERSAAMAECIKTGGARSALTGTVAVLGLRKPGARATAPQSCADSGAEVEVGLRARRSPSRAAAEEAGPDRCASVAEAGGGAQVVALLVPDGPQAGALHAARPAPNLAPWRGAPVRATASRCDYGR